MITITDVDRGNSGNETIKYEIHNKPIISYEAAANTFTAGEFGKISGIKLYDVDFEDKDKDGVKDPDELRQILKVELNSNGGKIKLTDPNLNPNNQIKVTVDVSDDERGATILGRSEEITSVLSSLEFSGDPNRVSGSVTIKASDRIN